MILHFLPDGLISNDLVNNFLHLGGEHTFLVFSRQPSTPIQHIDPSVQYVQVFGSDPKEAKRVIAQLSPKAIILHSLPSVFAQALAAVPISIPICWMVWGYDLYELSVIKPRLYAPFTRQFLLKRDWFFPIRVFMKSNPFFRWFFYRILLNRENKEQAILNVFPRIRYFCTYIREDYDVFTSFFPYRPEYVESVFSSIDQYLAGRMDAVVPDSASNVLIGNSNSATSNYPDAIRKVAPHAKLIDKVFVILSYGEEEGYAEEVLACGKQYLGSQFHPVLTVMDRHKYIELLQSCHTGVFYHYRQQAMGNIIAMLYLGCRVYLSEENPAFKYFIRNEISVFSIEKELDQTGFSHLNPRMALENRQKMMSLFSKEKVESGLRNMVNTLLG